MNSGPILPARKSWNKAFFFGSLIAVLSQGFALGGILTGIKVSGEHFAGGPFDWLNPFSVMVGIALIPGYIMLGASLFDHQNDGAGSGAGL